MEGTKQVIFDSMNNKAIFNDLSFTSYGLYFLKFHIASSPVEYEFYEEVSITVNSSITVENSTSKLVEATFNATYDDVIKGDVTALHFGTAVTNKFARENPETRCNLVNVRRG